MEASLEQALEHGLTDEEYRRILEVLGRVPSIEELGVFSAMWSEHCSYKSSRLLLRELPTSGPQVLQGPGENAGVVDVGEGLAVVFKIESHNHPSFVEPYQGAATGVGGILRDIFAMGARPVASLNSLRFGELDHPRTNYLLRGVVAGIGDYGNSVGVPTVGGEVYFDAAYDRNILVNAFTLGIVRVDSLYRAAAAGVGNLLLYVGSKTGRDGIHGASLLASAEFDSDSDRKRPTVQVGDPFTEKLLLEACLEAIGTGSLVGIQDMGAAGLTSSAAEMAGRGGNGVELDLSAVPMRETGMTPYEVLLSESQERMLLVVKAGEEEKVKSIFSKWDLDAVVVGRVTGSGRFQARWEGKMVADIPVAALTTEAPAYSRPRAQPAEGESAEVSLRKLPEPADYNDVMLRLLSSPNLCSREWVYRQYDSYVGGDTVVRPGSDAAVLRLDGTKKGVAMSLDGNSRFCRLDPYVGAVIAVAEGARNVVASGARPLAITNCLNFGNPEKPQVMWQFEETIYGLRDACRALGTPVVSGNVSFYNETEGHGIPPTPVVGMVGLIEDVGLHLTQWFKEEGDLVVLLGRSREEIGGSEYLDVIHGEVKGPVPWIDLKVEKALHAVCLAAAREGILRSAHDVAEGGLAIALAESSLSADNGVMLGARVQLEAGLRPDAALFGESQSRMIVSLRRRHLNQLRELCRREQVPMLVLGEVGGSRLEIGEYVDLPLKHLYEIWKGALGRQVEGRTRVGVA